MSSYFPSFNYLGINSREQGLVIAHFDADQGEVDTFLGMDPVYTESAYGLRRLDYGAKHNNVATFRVTMIKPDGNDLSVAEVRKHLRWLTGARQNSPLELTEHFTEEFISDGTKVLKLTNTCDHVFQVYVKNTLLTTDKWSYDKTTNSIIFTSAQTRGSAIKISYNQIKYYFIGRITNAWQYKMDSRTVGLIFEFTSVSPWAYSVRQTVSRSIVGSQIISIDNKSDDLYGYTPMNIKFTDKETQLLTNTQDLTVGTTINAWNILSEGVSTYSNSDGFYRIKLEGSGMTADAWRGIRSPLVELPSDWQNKQVTLSAWIWSADWASMNAGGQGPITWTLCLSQGTAVRGYYGSKYNIVKPNEVVFGTDAKYDTHLVNNKWIKVWVTFTLNRAGLPYPTESVALPSYEFGKSTHMFVQFFLRRNGEYRIYAPKLEWGGAATPWSGASGETGRALSIANVATEETTTITNIVANETISISDNMIITSDNTSKVFGNTFNFVFPRLVAGKNELTVNGTGDITFDYVYPIKIGDCAIDVNTSLDSMCYDNGNGLS